MHNLRSTLRRGADFRLHPGAKRVEDVFSGSEEAGRGLASFQTQISPKNAMNTKDLIELDVPAGEPIKRAQSLSRTSSRRETREASWRAKLGRSSEIRLHFSAMPCALR
jgi:hypothetical protein